MPDEWVLSRICEEGLAMNLADAARQPIELALRVMELRAYARAKDMVDRSENAGDLPTDSPMVNLVLDNQADIFAAAHGLGKKRKDGARAGQGMAE